MPNLLPQLITHFPDLTFTPGSSFYWSPEKRTIFYDASATGAESDWKLLHETAHGLLNHRSYQSDFELLQLESAAWQEAVKLSSSYAIGIDPDHIEDCLDSYRDWLHARSTCPVCYANGLQTSPKAYSCINCNNTWLVSHSRFCRPYRRLTV